MDTTTTEAPVESGAQTIQGVQVDDQGMAVAQPETTEQAEAVTTTTEPVEQTGKPEQETEQPLKSKKELPAEEYRKQLEGWAAKKGLTLDSDNATKAAEMAMEAERNMHKVTERSSKLEKSVTAQADEYANQVAEQTGQDPEVLKRLQRVEVKEAVRDFWNTPDASGNTPDKSLEPKMIELLKDKPYLAGDLDALYATAMVKSGGFDAVKSQGKREALESLAHKQQAAVPTGNAVNSSVMSGQKITPQNVDQLVGQNDLAWFEKNREAINQAMAG